MKKMYFFTVITIILISILFLISYSDENAICIDYLRSMGYETEGEPVMTEEYIIPKEFDSALYDYNLLQITSGYDLSRYKGKKAMRYTYLITNCPDIEVYSNILFLRGRIIGADLMNPKLNGFLLPMTHKKDFIKNHIPAKQDAVIP